MHYMAGVAAEFAAAQLSFSAFCAATYMYINNLLLMKAYSFLTYMLYSILDKLYSTLVFGEVICAKKR